MGADQLTDAEVALLGLLSEGPMHAWQIEKTVQDRDMRFWTDLSQSTIYKQLRALRQAGLLQHRRQVVQGRLRKVVGLTEAGEKALRAALGTLLSEPQHLKWRVDLGTYNLHLLPRRRALACLRTYRRKLEEKVRGYRELDAFLKSGCCPTHRRAVARRPIYLLQAEIRWLDSYVRELQRR
jgi:DNA-binding PadR family transcriptional regulator